MIFFIACISNWVIRNTKVRNINMYTKNTNNMIFFKYLIIFSYHLSAFSVEKLDTKKSFSHWPAYVDHIDNQV